MIFFFTVLTGSAPCLCPPASPRRQQCGTTVHNWRPRRVKRHGRSNRKPARRGHAARGRATHRGHTPLPPLLLLVTLPQPPAPRKGGRGGGGRGGSAPSCLSVDPSRRFPPPPVAFAARRTMQPARATTQQRGQHRHVPPPALRSAAVRVLSVKQRPGGRTLTQLLGGRCPSRRKDGRQKTE